MMNSNALRFQVAGHCAPQQRARNEYQVLLGGLLAFLAGSAALAMHALAMIGQ